MKANTALTVVGTGGAELETNQLYFMRVRPAEPTILDSRFACGGNLKSFVEPKLAAFLAKGSSIVDFEGRLNSRRRRCRSRLHG